MRDDFFLRTERFESSSLRVFERTIPPPVKKFIRLASVDKESRRVTYHFESSLDIFKKKRFSLWYDRDLPPGGPGILAVPFAAVMAPLSWMTGADLEIPVLDEAYEASLRTARGYFLKWFSRRWSFAGTLRTKTEKYEGGGRREGMLYSGGLDSLTSYLRHRDKKPLLFSFFGVDIPLDQPVLLAECRKAFSDLARTEGVDLCFIESDVLEMIDLDRIRRFTRRWWGETTHALALSAFTAPVSHHELSTLWIASSHVAGSATYGWGSDYEMDNELRWGATRLQEDFSNADRSEKIRFFAGYPAYHRFLRVCYNWWSLTGTSVNCGRCEKCYRTICLLMVNGLDPAQYGFEMSPGIFQDLKKQLLKKHVYYSFFQGSTISFEPWEELQRAARRADAAPLDQYGSREFFAWLARHRDISAIRGSGAGRLIFALREARWKLLLRIKRL